MTAKKVMLAILCVLLATVLIMTGILIGRVGELAAGLMGPNTSTTAPSSSADTTSPEPTTQPTTQPTALPTTAPTAPPTTEPTDPDHEHEYELTEKVEATCENYGYSIYTCIGCGKQDIPLDEQVMPFGHNYGAGKVIDATCTASGCTRYTCSRCGDVDERNYQSALGHDLCYIQTVAPTCEAGGYDLWQCSRCTESELRNETAMLGHVMEVVGEETLPTCTEDGFAQYQCVQCLMTEDVVIPATGHVYSEWIQNDDGSISRYCLHCDATQSSAEFVWRKQESIDDNAVKTYIVYVGTADAPELMCFTIYDYLNQVPLGIGVDPYLGLVVTYTDGTGAEVTVYQRFFDTTPIVIAAG